MGNESKRVDICTCTTVYVHSAVVHIVNQLHSNKTNQKEQKLKRWLCYLEMIWLIRVVAVSMKTGKRQANIWGRMDRTPNDTKNSKSGTNSHGFYSAAQTSPEPFKEAFQTALEQVQPPTKAVQTHPLFFSFFQWAAQLLGSELLDQVLNLGPQQWKHTVLTTGLPGDSQSMHLCTHHLFKVRVPQHVHLSHTSLWVIKQHRLFRTTAYISAQLSPVVWGLLVSWFCSIKMGGLWRRKWQPTPVFLPGESWGQRSLGGCSPRRCRVGHDWSDSAAAAAAVSAALQPILNLN